MAQTYKKGKLYELSISDLKPDPNQPRKSMDPQALEELVASIKTHGIIQPILFRVEIQIGGQISNLSPSRTQNFFNMGDRFQICPPRQNFLMVV